AVAHPNLPVWRHALEQAAPLGHMNRGPAVLARRSVFDLAAKHLAGELHAVADAKHRNALAKDFRIALGGARLINARRAARENQSFGRQFTDTFGRNIVPDDLAIDVLLAHPPGDQLRILGAEIENEHLFVGDAARLVAVSLRAGHGHAQAKTKKPVGEDERNGEL